MSTFEALRPRLDAIAYRMLGAAGEAELREPKHVATTVVIFAMCIAVALRRGLEIRI